MSPHRPKDKDPVEQALDRMIDALLSGHADKLSRFEEQARRFGDQAEEVAKRFGSGAEVEARRISERIEAEVRRLAARAQAHAKTQGHKTQGHKTQGHKTQGHKAQGHRGGPPLGHVHDARHENRHARRTRERLEARDRRRQHRARNRKQKEEAPKAVGVVFAVFALLLTWMSLTVAWWLIFVALGLGISAAGILSQPSRSKGARETIIEGEVTRDDEDAEDDRALESGAATEAAARAAREAARPEKAKAGSAAAGRGEKAATGRAGKDAAAGGGTRGARGGSAGGGGGSGEKGAADSVEDPRLARVDRVCERLLAEVRAGPDILKQVVRRPEETVKTLRQAYHELARRERDLRAVIDPADDARLARERADLDFRMHTEKDTVTRERLRGALAELDEQITHRASVATSASRLDAEQTRLVYTLENLHAQVLRVRSAGAGGAELANAELHASMDRLGDELGAVAEALEEVNREDLDAARARGRTRS